MVSRLQLCGPEKAKMWKGRPQSRFVPPQRSHQLVTPGNGETETEERKWGVGCGEESSERGGGWWWNQDNG